MSHFQSILTVFTLVSLSALACSEGNDGAHLEHGSAALCGDPSDGGIVIPPIVVPDAQPVEPHFDCQVALSKLSYDSPGADQAEFLELRISGVTESEGQRATLADCGVESLALVNGASSACDIYRTIPIGDQQVPADGYFLMCADTAQTALGTTCNLTGWDRSHLADGWLQNGPNDGLLLQGAIPSAYSYEGSALGCAEGDWQELPADTGELINGLDDVLTACNSEFLRMSNQDAPLRGVPNCPQSSQPDAATPNPATISGRASNSVPASTSDAGRVGSLQITESSATPAPAAPSVPDSGTAVRPFWQVKTAADSGSMQPDASPALSGGCQLSAFPLRSTSLPWGSAAATAVALPLCGLLLRRRSRAALRSTGGANPSHSN